MKYINADDIYSIIQEKLIETNVLSADAQDFETNTMLADIENKVIELISSYISARYDCSLIFATEPVRNEVLVQIIASIVVYRVIRRNAARKVPEDLRTLYDDSIKDLERIQKGALALGNLPLVTQPDGTTGIKAKWGNNTNNSLFI